MYICNGYDQENFCRFPIKLISLYTFLESKLKILDAEAKIP